MRFTSFQKSLHPNDPQRPDWLGPEWCAHFNANYTYSFGFGDAAEAEDRCEYIRDFFIQRVLRLGWMPEIESLPRFFIHQIPTSTNPQGGPFPMVADPPTDRDRTATFPLSDDRLLLENDTEELAWEKAAKWFAFFAKLTKGPKITKEESEKIGDVPVRNADQPEITTALVRLKLKGYPGV
jgi:hypothetical protein